MSPGSGLRGCAPEVQLARHQAEELALALLRHGARVGIVHWATGLKLDVLAGWYRHLHGRAPPRGPLPDSSGSMIRTRTEQVHASLFGVIYTRHDREGASERAIDLRGLVYAYELYLALTREATLSINAAWILARDLRAGLASIGWCTACHAPYIALTESILIGCGIMEQTHIDIFQWLMRGSAVRASPSGQVPTRKLPDPRGSPARGTTSRHITARKSLIG